MPTRITAPVTIERVDQLPGTPEISVIVPLPDHQGLAPACLRSLVLEQTCARDRFEVVVVTDGTDPALDSRIKRLLGPQDRMITHPTTNLHVLYNLGASEARGRILFITEPHCIVEPECLEELVNFFATHDYDVACCRSVNIPPANAWARMEARFFDPLLQIFSREGDWRKVLLRGFAIYRHIYLEEGGFDHAYNRFGEWALAAKLHSRGRRFGCAARATVRHPLTTGPSVLFLPVRNFTRGECAYRASAPTDYCERYFGPAPEWSDRESLRPSIARSVCQAASRSLWNGRFGRGGWSMLRAQTKALLQSLPIALFGPRWRVLGAAWSLWMARTRCRVWRLDDRRLYRAYCDAHERMVRYGRLEYIAEYLRASAPTPPETYVYRLSKTQKEWLVGFHAIERWENESFRWSGPMSMVRVGLPMGSYDVQIETRSLRKAPVPLCLGVFFNGHKVPSSSIRFHNGQLAFRVLPAMFAHGPEQRLILTCNPVRPWTFGVSDRRELGLPIFTVAFTPTREA